MASNQDSTKHVLSVDQQSDTDLQALFDSVLKPDAKKPQAVPFRQRKLPESFFNPPTTGSKSVNHSRESSVDYPFANAAAEAPATPPAVTPIQNVHHRAHSSPASLQQTYAVEQKPQYAPQVPHHTKQRSYDVAFKQDDKTPLPYGWEQAYTAEGQVYYINHTTRTTTWDDPRKTVVPTTARPPVNSSPQAFNVEVVFGPLPDGWEQAQTEDGTTYFINHRDKTTSWFDPRIPQHLQQRQTNANWNDNQQASAQQQQTRLMLLQLERDRLRQRQHEIIRQQQLMLRASPQATNAEPARKTEPFLESMEDMDVVQTNTSLTSTLPTSPGLPAPVMTSLSEMDLADDLLPSLQLGEEFQTDFLNDLQMMIPPSPTKDGLLN